MNKGMLVCSFSLKSRYGKENDLLYLNDKYECEVDGNLKNFNDVFSMLKDFSKFHETYRVDENLQKMFAIDIKTINQYSDDFSNSMSFIIRSGSYGIEADMTDKNTKKVNYRRNKDEADIKRFICYVYVPKDIADCKIKKGIIIFQSIAKYGVKTITTNYMRDYFSTIGITLEIKSVSPKAFFDKLIKEGKINELTIIKNCVSKNITDNLLIENGKVKTSYINPIFKTGGLKKVIDWFNKKSDNSNIELCEIVEEDIEDVVLNFNLNGYSRTIRLSSLDKLSIVEEIPKSIITEEEIIEYMKNTAESYKENLICH